MSKKPKPATVGTRIAIKHSVFPDGRVVYGPVWAEHIARRTDAALRRERMKERRRCSRIVVAYIGSEIGACEMLAKVRSGEEL